MHDGVTARFIEPGSKEPVAKLPEDLIDAGLQARIMQDVFDNLQRPERQPEVSEALATHFFTINGLDQQAIHQAATLLTSTQGLGERFAQRDARSAATQTLRDAHQRVQGLVTFLNGLSVRDATTHDSQMALNLGTIEGRFSKLGLIDVTEPKMNPHGCHAVVPVVPLSAVPACVARAELEDARPVAAWPSHFDATLHPPMEAPQQSLEDMLRIPPKPGEEPPLAVAAADAPPISHTAMLERTPRPTSFVSRAQADKVYILSCDDMMAAKTLLEPHAGNNQVFSLLRELTSLCDTLDMNAVAYAARTLRSAQKRSPAGPYADFKCDDAEAQISTMERRVSSFIGHYDAWVASVADPQLHADADALGHRLQGGLQAALARAGVTYPDGTRTLVSPDQALGLLR